MPVASALAVLLALNLTWLLGFTSFLLGACLFPIALGVAPGALDHVEERDEVVVFESLLETKLAHAVLIESPGEALGRFARLVEHRHAFPDERAFGDRDREVVLATHGSPASAGGLQGRNRRRRAVDPVWRVGYSTG